MSLVARFLRFFFHHLYHGLAFTYDLVAWLVSFGKWNQWIEMILPYIEGRRTLELGHGPGHLLRILLMRGQFAVGLDESPQMGRLARRRLLRAGETLPKLTRGLGQALPFPAETFDTIVATFPAEYIFEPHTISEAWRTLKNGSRMVVLPVAWPRNRFLAWLFRLTRQSPSEALRVVETNMSQPFARAGFNVRVEVRDVKSSRLLLVLAQKLKIES